MTGFAVGALQDLFLNFLLDTLFFPCKELVVVLTAGTLGVKAPAVLIRPPWSCLGAKEAKAHVDRLHSLFLVLVVGLIREDYFRMQLLGGGSDLLPPQSVCRMVSTLSLSNLALGNQRFPGIFIFLRAQ